MQLSKGLGYVDPSCFATSRPSETDLTAGTVLATREIKALGLLDERRFGLCS